ncbi:ferrous iron transport protein B [Cellulomonas denverensis]|uniref:Ferrous iron transport protein B n=1 Tax=Cellulomonas denverensis TaxID=264297 RepID=A0A7X6QZS2_9CELL|nr:ferrous iron transport protein B [Cellulomonas denverensis]NKY23559.1 ferrous iron transport protein B [Cellulomonas denverensis]GIG26840.1 ferrous iron transport protein B [Cellulomonas denverensis]
MSCHEPAPSPRAGAGLAQQPLVALVGSPNVGKSTLFNALTGARQRVMNAPGTTVELQTGTWRHGRDRLRLLDLPGTYSLLARSPDEQVTADAVAGTGSLGVPDLVLVLVDATAPSRSLYLLGQVARTGAPLLAVLTMNDVARTRGVAVDPGALSAVLGIPVLATDPRAGTGLDDLGAAVQHALAEGVPPVRGLDPGADDEQVFDWADATVRALGTDRTPRRTRSDRVDRVLLDPRAGVPVFLAVMWAMFQLTTTVVGPLIDAVDSAINGTLADWVSGWLPGPPLVHALVIDGVLVGVGTVLSFAPLMALVFLAFALLEDSGYLARAAFVADRAMRAIGLDGRAMLPLVIGFGCNLPALSAARTLPHARSRLMTGLLIPYTACPARLWVFILFAGVFFPDHAGTVIFALYCASIALVVLGGLVLRRVLFRDLEREPLVLALPAYQRPRPTALLISVWTRVRSFVIKAGTVIVSTLVVVSVLQAVPVTGSHRVGEVPVEDSAFGAVATAIAPVFAPAGFDDWRMSAALVTGFVAKEVVVGSLAQSYHVAEPEDAAEAGGLGEQIHATLERTSGGHGSAAALAFMLFVLAYTPCLATVGEQRRLYGGRWTGGAVLTQLAVAWLLAVAVFQLGRAFW